MKTTIEFTDDERDRVTIALNAAEIIADLHDFSQRLRALEKYEDKDLYGLRELFHECFGEFLL